VVVFSGTVPAIEKAPLTTEPDARTALVHVELVYSLTVVSLSDVPSKMTVLAFDGERGANAVNVGIIGGSVNLSLVAL
jgi:hypothetical protein